MPWNIHTIVRHHAPPPCVSLPLAAGGGWPLASGDLSVTVFLSAYGSPAATSPPFQRRLLSLAFCLLGASSGYRMAQAVPCLCLGGSSASVSCILFPGQIPVVCHAPV